jgi:hypothetical protein
MGLGRICKLLLISVTLLILVTGCRPSPFEEARQLVPIGTRRDDAIRILGETAWYHQPCPLAVSIDDLFFFGSRKYDKADVVIVSSEPIDDIYVVYLVSSFEPYAWHTAYRDCLQRDMFED